MKVSASAPIDNQLSEEVASRLTTPHHNRHGQPLRGDGQRTRTRILVEILKLLASSSLSDVTMANVTKRLGLNGAAFYRYFSDIGEALIAAYECVLEDAEILPRILAQDWNAKGADAVAIEFIEAYYAVWRRHGRLLEARNALAAAGDLRFVECRRRLVEPSTQALAIQLEALRSPDAAPVEAAAAALVMAIEQAAATAITEPDRSPTWADLRQALAEMMVAAAGASPAPSLRSPADLSS
jgi:AcrR family transcriptional regulator